MAELHYVRDIEGEQEAVSMNTSRLWNVIHREFNHLPGKVRLFAHLDIVNYVRALDNSEIMDVFSYDCFSNL